MSVRQAKSILLLEEQPEIGAMLRSGLERLDVSIRVQLVSGAQQAAQAMLAERFDLLIADVASPGLSGLELMQRGRQQNPELQTILLSATHDPKIRSLAAKAGVHAFFYKPVELADLLDAVERIFGLVRSFLPPEIQASLPAEPAGQPSQIAQWLDELLFNLQAGGAGLYNRHGQLLAHTGDLPAQLRATLSPHLLAAHHAATHLAPESLQAFRSADQHLLLSSMQPGYALLLATQPLNAARLAAHTEAISQCLRRALPELEHWQAERNQPAQTPASVTTDPQLEAALELAETKPINRSETDKFWKEQEQDLQLLPAAGTLTYEQASLLGLTPGN